MNAKNHKSHAMRAMRRKSKRGVSPIIATILLVAITVVLAAVLYVLVSGLTRTGASTPYELGMSPSSNGGSGTTYTDVIALSPTTGLTTSAFGLKVTTPSATTYTLAAAVAGTGCWSTAGTGLPADCTGVSGDWYAVLVSPQTGDVLATYTTAGWAYTTGVTTIALTNGYTLWVVTSIQVAGNSYTLSAYSTGSSSVSGSTLL